MMKGVWLLLFVCGFVFGDYDYCEGLSSNGQYHWGYVDTIHLRSTDDWKFDLYLYYPSSRDGKNAPYDKSGGPYPVIAIGHGLVTPDFAYTSYMRHFASHGYFVIAPAADYLWEPYQLASDIATSLDYIHNSNYNSSSWLYKQVSVNTTGLAGHSMGGLASLILSSTDKRFTAVAPIASVNAEDDVVAKITVPLMFISGSVDFLCDQSDIWEMYQVALTPKIQPEVVGGWHCGFMDESVVVPDFLCRPPIDWIYREQILELTRCLLTPFFNLYLKGNTSTSNYVWGSKIFDYKLVELNEDAGFSLLPSNQTVHFGSQQQAKFVAKLHNSFKNTNSFKLSVTNKSCPTVINPNFVTLKPGESQPIAIIMTIQSNGINFATIEAISQHDHETKQSCQVFAET